MRAIHACAKISSRGRIYGRAIELFATNLKISQSQNENRSYARVSLQISLALVTFSELKVANMIPLGKPYKRTLLTEDDPASKHVRFSAKNEVFPSGVAKEMKETNQDAGLSFPNQ